jgi:hypothetical protein
MALTLPEATHAKTWVQGGFDRRSPCTPARREAGRGAAPHVLAQQLQQTRKFLHESCIYLQHPIFFLEYFDIFLK